MFENRKGRSKTGKHAKVPILKECHFGKVKLWDVEHFWTLFVFTFGRDCYCIQQSRPKMKTKSVQKCSTSQSFTLPKWHSFKIGTLTKKGVLKKGVSSLIWSTKLAQNIYHIIKTLFSVLDTFYFSILRVVALWVDCTIFQQI